MRILKRYSSTIYGQYRWFGAKSGLWVGVVIAFSMLLAAWMEVQPSTPENYITDLVLLLGMAVAAYRYRRTLPDERVTLKELMLLGLWTGFVSATVYGVLLWLYGILDSTLVERFVEARLALMSMMGDGATDALSIQLVKNYSAGDWGFIGGFRVAVMSIFINLVIALVFRTEKAPVREKKKK